MLAINLEAVTHDNRGKKTKKQKQENVNKVEIERHRMCMEYKCVPR